MFKLEEEYYIEEIDSRILLYSHPTGARLMHIKNLDDNRVFFAAFPTPCQNDKGIPHVLEHCVLAGSGGYPIKDPFSALSKGSFHTYLNAMTYTDRTVYPVAGRSLDDFNTMTRVYLDAVFAPLLRKETFLQEGWNYELDKNGRPAGYGGIVYNEMSGTYSDPIEVLLHQGMKLLFPDNPFRFDAGGVPEEITSLDYKEFLRFYHEYYTPERCILYFYGDLDIEPELEYIHDKYLSAKGAIKTHISIPYQPAFSQPVFKTVGMPLEARATLYDSEHHYLYIGRVIGNRRDVLRQQAIRVLQYILLGMEASPLKRAVLDSEPGQDMQDYYYGDILQPVSIITVTSKQNDITYLFEKEQSVLKALLQSGLSENDLQAALDRLEFSLREKSYGYKPKGLVYGLRLLPGMLYDDSPSLELLEPLKTLKLLRKRGKAYYTEILERDFKNNPHTVCLELVPEKKPSISKPILLSKESIQTVHEEKQLLRDFQALTDKEEDLCKIPIINPKTIERELAKEEVIPSEPIERDGLEVLYHPIDTDGIIYFDLLFPTFGIPWELISAIRSLACLPGKLRTKKYSLPQLSLDMSRYSGSFSVSFQLIDEKDGGHLPVLILRAKCLRNNLSKTLEIIQEILSNSCIEGSRAQQLLSEQALKIERMYINEGQVLAVSRLLSYLNEGRQYKEMAWGYEAYTYMKRLLEANESEKINEILKEAWRIIFFENNMFLDLTCGTEDYEYCLEKFGRFYRSLPKERNSPGDREIAAICKVRDVNEAFVTGTGVQYVAGGLDIRPISFSGTVTAAAHILKSGYLMDNVRLQGGAYGCSAKFTRNNILYFYSYRDPHLNMTLQAYKKSFQYLQCFYPDEREMRQYLIGALNPLLRPMSNEKKGQLGLLRFLSGVTLEDIRREKQELLETEAKHIRRLGQMLEALEKEFLFCVNGSKSKIEENEEVFEKIHYIKQDGLQLAL